MKLSSNRQLESWEHTALKEILQDADPEGIPTIAEDNGKTRPSMVDGIIRLAVASASRALAVRKRNPDVAMSAGNVHANPTLEQRLVGLFSE